MMKRLLMAFCALSLPVLAHAQTPPQSPREEFNRLVTQFRTDSTQFSFWELNNELLIDIMRAARTLKPPPAMSPAAEESDARAQYIFRTARSEADYLAATKEYLKAIVAAPWVGSFYFNTCAILQKTAFVAQAAHACSLYLLSTPDASDAREVRSRLVGLEYEQQKLDESQADDLDRRFRRAMADSDSASNPRVQWYRHSLSALRGAFVYRAEKLTRARKYEDALVEINEFLALRPTDGEAFNARGRVYSESHNYEEAIREYTEAIRLNPTEAKYYDSRARAYRLSGNLDGALGDSNRAIRLKDWFGYFATRGYVFADKGDYEKALQDFDVVSKSAVPLSQRPADFLYDSAEEQSIFGTQYTLARRGFSYRAKHDDVRALQDFEAASRQGRGMAGNSLGFLGRALMRYDDFAEMQGSFGDSDDGMKTSFLDALIKADPKDARALAARGQAYNSRAVGNPDPNTLYDKALQDFSAALALNPTDWFALTKRGDLYGRKNQPDLALRDYSAAILAKSDRAETYVARGGLSWQAKRYDEAIADYSEALRLTPEGHVDWWISRAYVYLEKGDTENAARDTEEVLKRDPKHIQGYFLRGSVYVLRGEYAAAIREYNTAIGMYAPSAGALYGRGVAKRKSGDAAGGDADIAAAIRITPTIADAMAARGIRP